MARAKKKEAEAVGFEDGEEEGVVVDLSDTDESERGEVLPRGIYDTVVTECDFDYSQSSNNPMWSWQLQVESGEFEGRTLYYHTTFTDKTRSRQKRDLLAVDPEFLEETGGVFNPEKVADEGRFIGKRCRAKVTIKRYEGRQTNNTRELLPPSEGGDGFA